MQQDNSTLNKKVALRKIVLAEVDSPIILETHGGVGEIYKRCYGAIPHGMVCEQDRELLAILARQRPTWRVYGGDSSELLQAGLAADVPFNVIDLDPYGELWPTLDGYFQSDRLRPDVLHIVVNDGLRQKVQVSGAWRTNSLKAIVQRLGNNLYDCYLEVCQELIKEKAASAGFTLSRFRGYYCGKGKGMTHWYAVLQRSDA